MKTVFSRILRASVLVVLPFFAAACSGDATGPSSEYNGTYALVEADGESLPATVEFHAGPQVFEFRVHEGSYTLANGRYDLFLRVTQVDGGEEATVPPLTDSGTYTVADSVVTFTSDDSNIAAYTGTIADGELITEEKIGAGTMQAVFRR